MSSATKNSRNKKNNKKTDSEVEAKVKIDVTEEIQVKERGPEGTEKAVTPASSLSITASSKAAQASGTLETPVGHVPAELPKEFIEPASINANTTISLPDSTIGNPASATKVMSSGTISYIPEKPLHSSYEWSYLRAEISPGESYSEEFLQPRHGTDPITGQTSLVRPVPSLGLSHIIVQLRSRPFAKPFSLRKDLVRPHIEHVIPVLQGEGPSYSMASCVSSLDILIDLLSWALDHIALNRYIVSEKKDFLTDKGLYYAISPPEMPFLFTQIEDNRSSLFSHSLFQYFADALNTLILPVPPSAVGMRALGTKVLPPGGETLHFLYANQEEFRAPMLDDDYRFVKHALISHQSMRITRPQLREYLSLFLGSRDKMEEDNWTARPPHALRCPQPAYYTFAYFHNWSLDLRERYLIPYLIELADHVATFSLRQQITLDSIIGVTFTKGGAVRNPVAVSLMDAIERVVLADVINMIYYPLASIYYKPTFQFSEPGVTPAVWIMEFIGSAAYINVLLNRNCCPPRLRFMAINFFLVNVTRRMHPNVARVLFQWTDLGGYSINCPTLALMDFNRYDEQPTFLLRWNVRPRPANPALFDCIYKIIINLSYTTGGRAVFHNLGGDLFRVPSAANVNFVYHTSNSCDRKDDSPFFSAPIEWQIFSNTAANLSQIVTILGKSLVMIEQERNVLTNYLSTLVLPKIRDNIYAVLMLINAGTRIAASTSVAAHLLPPPQVYPAGTVDTWVQIAPDILNPIPWEGRYCNGVPPLSALVPPPGIWHLEPARGIGVLEKADGANSREGSLTFESNRRKGDELVMDLYHYTSAFTAIKDIVTTGVVDHPTVAPTVYSQFRRLLVGKEENWKELVLSAKKFFPEGRTPWATFMDIFEPIKSKLLMVPIGVVPVTNDEVELVSPDIINCITDALILVTTRHSTLGYCDGFTLGTHEFNQPGVLNGAPRPTHPMLEIRIVAGPFVPLARLTGIQPHWRVERYDPIAGTYTPFLPQMRIPGWTDTAALPNAMFLPVMPINRASVENRLWELPGPPVGLVPLVVAHPAPGVIPARPLNQLPILDIGAIQGPGRPAANPINVPVLDLLGRPINAAGPATFAEGRLIPQGPLLGVTLIPSHAAIPISAPPAHGVLALAPAGPLDACTPFPFTMNLHTWTETPPDARRWYQRYVAPYFPLTVTGRCPVEVAFPKPDVRTEFPHSHVFNCPPGSAPILTHISIMPAITPKAPTFDVASPVVPFGFHPMIYAENILTDDQPFEGYSSIGYNPNSVEINNLWVAPQHSRNLFVDHGVNVIREIHRSYDYQPVITLRNSD